MGRDPRGFGFGTLTGESCLKNVHCHTDPQFRLGEGGGGGGIPLGGGGSANREPGSYIYIYIYIYIIHTYARYFAYLFELLVVPMPCTVITNQVQLSACLSIRL